MEAFLTKNKLRNILLLSLLAPVPLLAQPVQQASLLSGILRTAAGTPLAGAQVGILKRAPASARATLPFPTGGLAARTTTGPTGLFQIPAKLAGDHLLCVQPADFIHLDPCLWGAPQPFTLNAGQDRGFGTVTLPRGVELRVVVEDPGSLLGPAESAGRSPSLAVGYQGATGIFTPMRLQSITANGSGNNIQYAVAIPPNVDVRVVLITHTLQLTGEGAAVLRPGGGSPVLVRATAAETSKTLRFRVGPL
jgi:hypothetical protein